MTTATITVPAQHVERFRSRLRTSLACDQDSLDAYGSLDEIRRTTASMSTWASVLEQLGEGSATRPATVTMSTDALNEFRDEWVSSEPQLLADYFDETVDDGGIGRCA